MIILLALDPTQRAFADRVLKWAAAVADTYEAVRADGRHRRVPVLRSFLGGSAGSGKSTTLKTCVQHVRLMFMKRKVPAKVELTAYTGVAAFNIGFGARTACSAFQVFPNAAWKNELEGAALRSFDHRRNLLHWQGAFWTHAFPHSAGKASTLQ